MEIWTCKKILAYICFFRSLYSLFLRIVYILIKYLKMYFRDDFTWTINITIYFLPDFTIHLSKCYVKYPCNQSLPCVLISAAAVPKLISLFSLNIIVFYTKRYINIINARDENVKDENTWRMRTQRMKYTDTVMTTYETCWLATGNSWLSLVSREAADIKRLIFA